MGRIEPIRALVQNFFAAPAALRSHPLLENPTVHARLRRRGLRSTVTTRVGALKAFVLDAVITRLDGVGYVVPDVDCQEICRAALIPRDLLTRSTAPGRPSQPRTRGAIPPAGLVWLAVYRHALNLPPVPLKILAAEWGVSTRTAARYYARGCAALADAVMVEMEGSSTCPPTLAARLAELDALLSRISSESVPPAAIRVVAAALDRAIDAAGTALALNAASAVRGAGGNFSDYPALSTVRTAVVG